jgi:hypothetical protein
MGTDRHYLPDHEISIRGSITLRFEPPQMARRGRMVAAVRGFCGARSHCGNDLSEDTFHRTSEGRIRAPARRTRKRAAAFRWEDAAL